MANFYNEENGIYYIDDVATTLDSSGNGEWDGRTYVNGVLQVPVVNLASGLQAFYKLSDTSDSSGNNRTLTNNGNVSFASGKLGNAAVFDGQNYLSNTGNAVLGTSDFSVAGWVNATNLDSSQKMYYVGGSNGFTISLMDGILHTANANVADLYDFNSSDITNNSWFHLLVKRNGAIFTAYVNGQSIGTHDSGDTIEFTGDSQFIGAYIDGGYNLEGKIDAVGIWNRALSDSEVAALYNSGTGLELQATLETGLQAFYKLSDLSDSSGNNRTLTNNGNVSFASGKIGNAAEFVTGKHISLGTPFNLSQATVAGWVKINHTETKQTSWWGGYEDSIISLCNDVENTDTAPMFEVCYMSEGAAGQDGVGDRLRLWNGQDQFFAGSATGDGQWHFFAVRHDNGTWKMQVDSLSGEMTSYVLANANLLLRMGTARGETDNLEGQMDAVGIWNRALSDAEVAALYNSRNGLELPAPTGPTIKNGWITDTYWINDVATTLDQNGDGKMQGKLYEGGTLFSGTKYSLTFVDGLAQPENIVTVIGNNIPVAFGLNEAEEPLVELVFASITSAGETVIEQIIPTVLPTGYTVAETVLAYSIDTTATFEGTINVDFILPSNISQAVFDRVKGFHVKDNGSIEEMTRVSSDFSTKRITVAITSFSDFLFLDTPAPSGKLVKIQGNAKFYGNVKFGI